jgi:hypothetical protein
MTQGKLRILVSLSGKRLQLFDAVQSESRTLLDIEVVSGCESWGTPAGSCRAGKWIKDKTNPIHGETPWSADHWSNP